MVWIFAIANTQVCQRANHSGFFIRRRLTIPLHKLCKMNSYFFLVFVALYIAASSRHCDFPKRYAADHLHSANFEFYHMEMDVDKGFWTIRKLSDPDHIFQVHDFKEGRVYYFKDGRSCTYTVVPYLKFIKESLVENSTLIQSFELENEHIELYSETLMKSTNMLEEMAINDECQLKVFHVFFEDQEGNQRGIYGETFFNFQLKDDELSVDKTICTEES